LIGWHSISDVQQVELVAVTSHTYQSTYSKRRNLMLWTIIVILIILWALGFFGRNISPSFPQTGGWIHILIVIALILVVLTFLNII